MRFFVDLKKFLEENQNQNCMYIKFITFYLQTDSIYCIYSTFRKWFYENIDLVFIPFEEEASDAEGRNFRFCVPKVEKNKNIISG